MVHLFAGFLSTFSFALLSLGMEEEALEHVARAVEYEPGKAAVHQAGSAPLPSLSPPSVSPLPFLS